MIACTRVLEAWAFGVVGYLWVPWALKGHIAAVGHQVLRDR